MERLSLLTLTSKHNKDGARTVEQNMRSLAFVSPPRVLVIEDDVLIATLIHDILTNHGYHVDIATDDHPFEASREYLPDVIMVDFMMPTMNGREAVEGLRAQPDTSDIPIILMSAVANLPAQAKSLGLPHYLAKPFGLDALLSIVQSSYESRPRRTPNL